MAGAENFTRLSQALALLGDALRPYVERELKRAGGNWWTQYVLPHVSPLTRQKLPSRPARGANDQLAQVDMADLLNLVIRNWAIAFRGKLDDRARSWAEELLATRPQWAHKGTGDLPKALVDRAIDTAALLLDGIDPSAAAVLRELNQPEAAVVPQAPETGKAPEPSPAAANGASGSGMRPWRECATPRQDVRSGRLTLSQFAADLHEVYRGNPEAGAEYLDPREFFERTFVTSGVREFMKSALRRLTATGGDPVVQLKTGFGGGKTHTMLALYHMARSGRALRDEIPVLKELSQEVGVDFPETNVAVLVGTKISSTSEYQDEELRSLGVSLKTLWGHLAWQLGKWNAYKLVQAADEAGVAPAEELRQVLEMCAPCVILMDEIVAYGRNLPTRRGQVPGGTLESMLTFVQSLSELVKATPRTILAVSIPESDQEIGGTQGVEVLKKLESHIGRVETPWQPVTPQESFEVVRRRLFEHIDPDGRDQTVATFIRYYRQNPADFPPEAVERAYEERMRAAYPFHPELFDRLYLDWHPNVAHFQYTRGVLRMLAVAVQAMWREGDQSALITPSKLRLDIPSVREELMRYLPVEFQPVLDGDIEGPNSEAVQIDATNPRFGQVAAARSVARTVLLGSVPRDSNLGIEDVRIRLGAAWPGEPVATFNDALGRLRERAQFLHGSGTRFWFGVRPNLNRVVADRKSRIHDDEAYAFLRGRLEEDRERGPFPYKHVAPPDAASVPDDTAARLVIAPPQFAHRDGLPEESNGLKWCKEISERRGSAARQHRNMLTFALLDESVLPELKDAAKTFLAWDSVTKDRSRLNLDEEHQREAAEARDKASSSVDRLLNDGYRWVALPRQEVRRKEDGTWEALPEHWRILDTSQTLAHLGPLAQRVGSALQAEELLLESWSPYFLKQELERWFWSQGLDHVSAKKLWEENISRYTYFPRLRDTAVFTKTVLDGATSREFFGFALGYEAGKYVGLSFGERPNSVVLDEASVIVRREVAEREAPRPVAGGDPVVAGDGRSGEPGKSQTSVGGGGATTSPPIRPAAPRRFYGRIRLNHQRLSSSAGQVAEEVLQHLAGLMDSHVEVELEINVRVPEGIPDRVVRTVSENAKTLKFDSFGFEAD